MRVERDGGTRRREGHALSAIAEHDGVPRVVAVERLGDLGRHLVAGNAAAARRTAPVGVKRALSLQWISERRDSERVDAFDRAKGEIDRGPLGARSNPSGTTGEMFFGNLGLFIDSKEVTK